MGTDLEDVHYEQLMKWVKPVERIGELAPAFVNNYAEVHKDKVFQSEDGRDTFVEMESEASELYLATTLLPKMVLVSYILHLLSVPMTPK